MTEAEAIAELNAMNGATVSETVDNHERADEILAQFAQSDVARAWRAARSRVGFYYA